MNRICDIVKTAMATGYLSVDAEEQLRLLLRSNSNPEELTAFTRLQLAAASGEVRQESREQLWAHEAKSA